jgi:hypothetical protein
MIAVNLFKPLILKRRLTAITLLLMLLLQTIHYDVSAFLRSSFHIRKPSGNLGGEIYMIKSYLDTLSEKPSVDRGNLSYLDSLSSSTVTSNPVDVAAAAAADRTATKIETILTDTKIYAPLGRTEDPHSMKGERPPDENRSMMGSYLDNLSSTRTVTSTEAKSAVGKSEALSTIVTIKGVPDGEAESLLTTKGSTGSAPTTKKTSNAAITSPKASKSPKGKSEEKKARMSALAFPDEIKKGVTAGYFLYVLAFGSAMALQVAIQKYPEEWASFVSRTYTSIDAITPASLKDLQTSLGRGLSDVTMESATITVLEKLRSGLVLENGVVRAKASSTTYYETPGNDDLSSGAAVDSSRATLPDISSTPKATVAEIKVEPSIESNKFEGATAQVTGDSKELVPEVNPIDQSSEISVDEAIQKFLKGLFAGEVTVESATKVESAIEEFLKTLGTKDLTIDESLVGSEDGVTVESQVHGEFKGYFDEKKGYNTDTELGATEYTDESNAYAYDDDLTASIGMQPGSISSIIEDANEADGNKVKPALDSGTNYVAAPEFNSANEALENLLPNIDGFDLDEDSFTFD